MTTPALWDASEPANRRPVPFGYKVSWLVTPARHVEDLAAAIGLDRQRPVNWRKGIDEAYRDSVFVSPSVGGWNFVVGFLLPQAYDAVWIDFLVHLSQNLGQIQYYSSHRGVGTYAWARAIDGRIERAYAFSEGEAIHDIGSRTAEETELAMFYYTVNESCPEEDGNGEDSEEELLISPSRIPAEENVLALAGRWSINPTTIGDLESEPFGVLGELST